MLAESGIIKRDRHEPRSGAIDVVAQLEDGEGNKTSEGKELRYLPPGSIFDDWKQFQDNEGFQCIYKHCRDVWNTHFGDKQTFRTICFSTRSARCACSTGYSCASFRMTQQSDSSKGCCTTGT